MRPFTIFVQAKFKSQKLLGAEIGVQEGNNASTLINMIRFEQLYLIDIWAAYKKAGRYDKGVENISFQRFYPKVIKRFGDRPDITIRKLSSVDASKKFPREYFHFVYIDANHTYEAVKEDIAVWFPKVKVNGVLGGHDYRRKMFPGVVRAVDEFIKKNKHKLYHKENDWWIVK